MFADLQEFVYAFYREILFVAIAAGFAAALILMVIRALDAIDEA